MAGIYNPVTGNPVTGNPVTGNPVTGSSLVYVFAYKHPVNITYVLRKYEHRSMVTYVPRIVY